MGDLDAIAAVVTYLMLGMGRDGRTALDTLLQLRAECYPDAVATVVALLDICCKDGFRPGAIEPVRSLICDFLEAIPSASKSDAISTLTLWFTRTSAEEALETFVMCLTRLCQTGHG